MDSTTNTDAGPAHTAPIERQLLSGGISVAEREPSPGFAASVMSAVRREARTPPPLRFPWKRLLLGSAASLAWLVLGFRAVAGADPAHMLDCAQSGGGLAALGLLLALLCLQLARFCVRG